MFSLWKTFMLDTPVTWKCNYKALHAFYYFIVFFGTYSAMFNTLQVILEKNKILSIWSGLGGAHMLH